MNESASPENVCLLFNLFGLSNCLYVIFFVVLLQAKADTIEALEKYRGRCEPCFLFFAVSDF